MISENGAEQKLLKATGQGTYRQNPRSRRRDLREACHEKPASTRSVDGHDDIHCSVYLRGDVARTNRAGIRHLPAKKAQPRSAEPSKPWRKDFPPSRTDEVRWLAHWRVP